MLLTQLTREHTNISRLLAVLEEELAGLERGDGVNYRLLRDVAEYLIPHAEQHHHCLEDQIYTYFSTQYPDEAAQIASLAQAHETLSAACQQFYALLQMVMADQIIPTALLTEKVRYFIALQRQHIVLEEQQIFPLLKTTLQPADWLQLMGQLQPLTADPLFGDAITAQYVQLATRLQSAVS
ncbi:hemerythrin domain-containing protein [Plesiomonas shigelloides]|uniref:hemerythrin domain-containing protein n=1 Tax=Plesiomonas shigelloides TaxID=703 RepID=UPI00224557B3|nr:hemerythrin domain-containing protein [Plesiomonas shigelloides]MCX2497728.1 hemerythrin domain-containing protein [Plesiomonas shigelloides]